MSPPAKAPALPASALRRPVVLLASGLGAGLSPVAPGTAGSLVGVLVYLATEGLPLQIYAAMVLALALAGVWICDRAGRALGVSDHPGIVWDEIVGVLIALAATTSDWPSNWPSGWPSGWLGVALGFGLFRLFDILKPWPVSVLDRRVPGGWGVMLDDVMAGLYALACLLILRIAFGIP